MTWEPNKVRDRLGSIGLPSRVIDDTVFVTIPEPIGNSPSMVDRLLRWIRGPKCITIHASDIRFINNLSVTYDPLGASLDFAWIEAVYRVLRDCGYDTSPEREIAKRYCPNSDQLDDLFERLEAIQAKKENRAAIKEFEAAANLRDECELLRIQIDRMVRDTMCRFTKKENGEPADARESPS